MIVYHIRRKCLTETSFTNKIKCQNSDFFCQIDDLTPLSKVTIQTAQKSECCSRGVFPVARNQNLFRVIQYKM